MHGSRSKPPVKNLVRQSCAEEFNSGVKGLKHGQRLFKTCSFGATAPKGQGPRNSQGFYITQRRTTVGKAHLQE
jgi:hypothetical protein